MLQLNNPDLQSQRAEQYSKPGIIRLFQAGDRLAPILKIQLDNAAIVPVPIPFAVGYHYVLELPYSIDNSHPSGYRQALRATDAVLESLWINGTQLHFYTTLKTSLTFLVDLLISTPPRDSSNNHILDFSGIGHTFAPTAAYAEGILFDNTRLTLDGTTVSLSTETAERLTVGSLICLSLEIQFTGLTPKDAIASFLIPEIDYLQCFDYLGVNYTGTRKPSNPATNEFTWNTQEKTANVFMDISHVPALPVAASRTIDTSSLSYPRPIN